MSHLAEGWRRVKHSQLSCFLSACRQAGPVRPEGKGLFEMIERDPAWRWCVHQYLSLEKTWEECEYNVFLWAPRPLPAWGDKLQFLWCYWLQPLAQKVVPVQHFIVKLMLAYFDVTEVLMSFLSRLHSKQIFFLETAVLREMGVSKRIEVCTCYKNSKSKWYIKWLLLGLNDCCWTLKKPLNK